MKTEQPSLDRWRDECAVYNECIDLNVQKIEDPVEKILAKFFYNNEDWSATSPSQYGEVVKKKEARLGGALYQVRALDDSRSLLIEGRADYVCKMIEDLSNPTGFESRVAHIIIRARDAVSFCESQTPWVYAVESLDNGITSITKYRVRAGAIDYRFKNLDHVLAFLKKNGIRAFDHYSVFANGESWRFSCPDKETCSEAADFYTYHMTLAYLNAVRQTSGCNPLCSSIVPSATFPSERLMMTGPRVFTFPLKWFTPLLFNGFE